MLTRLELSAPAWPANEMPATLAHRTRRLYDRVAPFYSISSQLFHSRAHEKLLEICGLRDGMKVLEAATGSGEMFRRLVAGNPSGVTIGMDLSANMAARTQQRVRSRYPGARARCHAVDARWMPYRDGAFDMVVCCYLLELLSGEDIVRTVEEFHRVLRVHGKLALIVIGENTEVFNRLYRVAGSVAPAFWGRQVERQITQVIEATDFDVLEDCPVQQGLYPSRILIGRR